MAHDVKNLPPQTPQQLRKFGISTGAIIAILFGLFFPWVFERALPWWPWAVFGVLSAWAIVAPATLDPVYRGWMKLGVLISRVTTPIILGVVFFLVIMPLGLIRRMFGRDNLARRFDDSAASYRVESDVTDCERLEHPY